MSPESRRLKPVEVVANFEETVALEMDLRLEAAAAAELAENFAADPDFRVPAVDWNRTGQRVLTLERIDGIPIDETESLAEAGIDPREVLARSARAFFHQVFRDGFFHADMHPGNMFVGSDGVLSPVDFGIMGRLDKRTRNFLADMLIAFLSRDYLKVADVHFAAGYVPNTKSRGAFSQACRAIAEPILGKPQNEISIAKLLGQLFQVTRTFEMETQPQLLLLQKTMLVAEGVGRKLDPDSNIWMLAEPLVEEWVLEHRGPEGRMREFVSEVVARAERLPQLSNLWIKYPISSRRMVSGCIRKQSMHFGRITVPRAIGALALLFWRFSSWRLSSQIFDAIQERSAACMGVDEGLNTVFKCKTIFPRREAGHDCRQAHTLDRLRGHRGIQMLGAYPPSQRTWCKCAVCSDSGWRAICDAVVPLSLERRQGLHGNLLAHG